MSDLDRAARAIRDGDLVVYPTETVYGLGADALDPDAVERVFDAKERPRDKPLSLGVHAVEAALPYVEIPRRTRSFMDTFLPGPVTVVCPKSPTVPDVLTGGRDRVGIRVPDHDVALTVLERAGPTTATSANRSGRGSVTSIDGLDPAIRDAAAVVLDGGETPGGGSTVVDPGRNEIHRAGPTVDAVREWLAVNAKTDG